MKHMKNFSESSVLPEQPALTERMEQQPQELPKSDIRSSALSGKVAIITGGDSGIGRAVAYLYAQQGI
jgi:NADP-dependent 3-hydroxy acid dehydrogenase YdfG